MEEPKKRKRKPISEETREKMRQAARNRSPESEARRVAGMKASEKYQETREVWAKSREGQTNSEDHRRKISEGRQRSVAEGRGVGWNHTPEMIAHMKEKRRQMWAEGIYKDAAPASRRRISKTEQALVPFLSALGYQHVDDDHPFYVKTPGSRGFVPDFVDREGKRVFEYFGNFWHHPNDEPHRITQYALAGWECHVLWEADLPQWVEEHRHLVPAEQAEAVLYFTRLHGVFASRGNSELPDPTSTV